MKTIGIKLADGSFFPVLEDNHPAQKALELTTAHNNQTKVMVDLYRSKSCSMDDAEYVDSLQIDNLVSHPNGEPSIAFSVALDENSQLSANIRDPETGNQSETEIPLVTRSEEELLVPDEYDISNIDDDKKEPHENDDEKPEERQGLLSAADKMMENKKKTDLDEPIFGDDALPDFDNNINNIADISDNDMFSTDDFLNFGNKNDEADDKQDNTDDEITSEDFVIPEPNEITDFPEQTETPLDTSDIPDFEEPAIEDTTEEDLPDFDNIPDFTEDNPEPDEPAAEDATEEDLPDFDNMPDFTEDAPEPDEPAAEDAISEDLPDFDNIPDFTNLDSFPEIEENSPETESDDDLEKSLEESKALNDIFSKDDPLPDFEDLGTNEPLVSDDNFFDMDNIDKKAPVTENENSTGDEVFGLPDEFNDYYGNDLDQFAKSPSSIDDFSLPDFPEDNSSPELPDNFFDDIDDSPNNYNSSGISSSGSDPLSFTGLYDKETEMGMSGMQNDAISKKTKVPVIICVICALICLAATAFIFFVKPKTNATKGSEISVEKNEEKLLDENHKDDQIKVIEEQPESQPAVPEAKEDEIIIIEQAEKVIPKQPEVIKEKLNDISYKVIWGDTLWDIANTYYKNPWKYMDIAKYNGIKNPDHIISGTNLIIPAE